MYEQKQRLGMIITKQYGIWEIHHAIILFAREIRMDIIPIIQGYDEAEYEQVQSFLLEYLTVEECVYKLTEEMQSFIGSLALHDTDVLIFHTNGELWKCHFNCDFIERMLEHYSPTVQQGTQMSKSKTWNSHYL